MHLACHRPQPIKLDVGVSRRRRRAGVPEPYLNIAQAGAGFGEQAADGVPQVVQADVGKACAALGRIKRGAQAVVGQVNRHGARAAAGLGFGVGEQGGVAYQSTRAVSRGSDLRSPARMRDQPARRFHGLPSAMTR